MNNQILSIIGTRPQLVKFSVIQEEFLKLKINHEYIDTGQHYDPALSTEFAKELQISQPKVNLNVGSASHNQQISLMVSRLDEVLEAVAPSKVLVYGDTNSTLAATLVSVKREIPVFHVEAGLRSNNLKMQEEINRKAVDHLSSHLFAPTLTAHTNLMKEGLSEISSMYGDVMFDVVLKLIERRKIQKVPGIYNNVIVCTIHRAENTSSLRRIKELFNALGKLNFEIKLFAHPRLRKTIYENSIQLPKNLEMLNPINHSDLLQIVYNCYAVITDSGGLQKETFFLGKRCITFRDESEWPETLNGNMNCLFKPGQDLGKLLEIETKYPAIQYFGDGKAAAAIVEHILGSC